MINLSHIWSTIGGAVELLSLCAAIAILGTLMSGIGKKRRRSSTKKNRTNIKNPSTNIRSTNILRPKEVILSTPIDQLSWREFEHLFAMYFRYRGFEVQETGVGGNDGGVDLVVINRRTKVRTAIQCKHHTNSIGPNVVRELKTARLSTRPMCVYARLITSAHITKGAKELADNLKIEYWHGGVLEDVLSKWPEWKGHKTTRARRIQK